MSQKDEFQEIETGDQNYCLHNYLGDLTYLWLICKILGDRKGHKGPRGSLF